MTKPNLPDVLTSLMAEFARSDLRELHVRKGDFELYLSNDAAAPPLQAVSLPNPAPPAPQVIAATTPQGSADGQAPSPLATPADTLPEGAFIVSAPNLGTFYRAPKPGAANYVEVGSKVVAGSELCLIEVMKLFTAVRAEGPGTVHAIFVEDGAMVEAGQPLFALVRD